MPNFYNIKEIFDMYNFQKTYERKLSYLTINHQPYQEFIGSLTKFWIITRFHVQNKKSKFIQNFKTSFRSFRLGIFYIKKIWMYVCMWLMIIQYLQE